MKNGEKSVATVDGLYRSVRKVVSIAAKPKSLVPADFIKNPMMLEHDGCKYCIREDLRMAS